MDNPSNKVQSAPPYSWLDALILMAQSPKPGTLRQILTDEELTAQRAYLWVLIGGILFGVALAGFYPSTYLISGMWLGIPAFSIDTSVYQPPLWAIVILGTTIGSVNSVIGFIAQTMLLKRLSILFGADNTYKDIAVLRGLFYPVLLTIRALILVILGYDTIATNGLLLVTIFVDFFATALVMTSSKKLSIQQSMMIVMGMNIGLFIGIVLFTTFGVIG